MESTVPSALIKDFNITIISDAHTTGNRPGLNAEHVIAHYNCVWSNMTPTKGKIDVKSYENLEGIITSTRQEHSLKDEIDFSFQ